MSTTSRPLVSIVVPVYEAVDTLRECLDSILAQKYRDWDCTIVDNCSTDGSNDVAREFAARDLRIRLCRNQTLLPAIANHNAALRQISSSSKYAKVVFADDWIFPDCLDEMIALAEEHPSVGLVGSYWLQGPEVAGTGLEQSRSIFPGREIGRRHFLDKLYVFGSANSVLYRADLVRQRNPFYNQANIHADTEICFDLLKSCDFGFVHKTLTFTRVRPHSLTATSADLQTNFAGGLRTLLAHGRDYLRKEELEALVDQRLTDYYQFLSTSLLRGRDKTFWSYHKAQLDAILGFSWSRLAGATIRKVGSAALNPKVMIEKLRNRKQDSPSADSKGATWRCQI